MLDAMIQQAIAGNHNLAAAQFTLAQAHEREVAQSGALYPQISLSAGTGRQLYGQQFLGGTISFPPFTYFSIGPTINYALDYGVVLHALSNSVRRRRPFRAISWPRHTSR